MNDLFTPPPKKKFDLAKYLEERNRVISELFYGGKPIPGLELITKEKK